MENYKKHLAEAIDAVKEFAEMQESSATYFETNLKEAAKTLKTNASEMQYKHSTTRSLLYRAITKVNTANSSLKAAKAGDEPVIDQKMSELKSTMAKHEKEFKEKDKEWYEVLKSANNLPRYFNTGPPEGKSKRPKLED